MFVFSRRCFVVFYLTLGSQAVEIDSFYRSPTDEVLDTRTVAIDRFQRSNNGVESLKLELRRKHNRTDVEKFPHVHLLNLDGAELRESEEIDDEGEFLFGVFAQQRTPSKVFAQQRTPSRERACSDFFYKGEIFRARLADEKVKYGRCALVGASGASPSQMFGDEIDSHDLVVRMNMAPYGGEHHQLVGSRSDLRVGNSWDAVTNLSSVSFEPGTDRVWLSVPKKGAQEGLLWQTPWHKNWLSGKRTGVPMCTGIQKMFGKHMFPCLDASQGFYAHLVHLKGGPALTLTGLNLN